MKLDLYCLDLKESEDAKIHFARDDNGNIIQPISVFWKGSNEGGNYHEGCNLAEAKVDESEYEMLINKTDAFTLADIDIHTHEWGREFNLKGTPSKACKICKTIVPVDS